VTSHSYGASQNSTFHNFVLPGLIITKLSMVAYVSDPYSDADFSFLILLHGKTVVNSTDSQCTYSYVPVMTSILCVLVTEHNEHLTQ